MATATSPIEPQRTQLKLIEEGEPKARLLFFWFEVQFRQSNVYAGLVLCASRRGRRSRSRTSPSFTWLAARD